MELAPSPGPRAGRLLNDITGDEGTERTALDHLVTAEALREYASPGTDHARRMFTLGRRGDHQR